jgi:hypothetical protein
MTTNMHNTNSLSQKKCRNNRNFIALLALGIFCAKAILASLYMASTNEILFQSPDDQAPLDTIQKIEKKQEVSEILTNHLLLDVSLNDLQLSVVNDSNQETEDLSRNSVWFETVGLSQEEVPCSVADHFRYEGIRLDDDMAATNSFLFTEFSKYSSIKSQEGEQDCDSNAIGQVIVARHGASEQNLMDFAESPSDTIQQYQIAEWGKSGFYFLHEQSQEEQRDLALFWGKQRQEAYGIMNAFGLMYWEHENNQKQGIERYAPKSAWIHADAFYPPCLPIENVHYKIPWTEGLRNKTILIVHPFIDTIKQQIPRLSEIWSKANASGAPSSCMPIDTMDQVKFVRAQLPVTNPTKSWVEVFNEMKQEITDVGHFDLAMVSCGGFGLPLLGHIASLPHKPSGIYLGGALQLYFGIHGSRWYSNGGWYAQWQESYTDAWTWPLDSDVSFSTVGGLENAAYVKPGQARGDE